MEKLEKAYKIIATIPRSSSRETYHKKAMEAFELCPGCVEATLLLNYFESDVYVRIDNLKKGLECIEAGIASKDTDRNLVINLGRTKAELANEYITAGKYEEALKLLETVDDNKYDTKFKKMSLYARLDDKRIEEYYVEQSEKAIDNGFIHLGLPYMVYLFKRNRKEDIKPIFDKLHDINPEIMAILKGERKEGEETNDQVEAALELLRNNSYLINDTPGFIEYLTELSNNPHNYS